MNQDNNDDDDKSKIDQEGWIDSAYFLYKLCIFACMNYHSLYFSLDCNTENDDFNEAKMRNDSCLNRSGWRVTNS